MPGRGKLREHLVWRANRVLVPRGLQVTSASEAHAVLTLKEELLRTIGDRVGPVDFPPEWNETIARTRQFTLTSEERIAGLIGAIEYVVAADIRGDFVECGLWRGGSSMAAALTFQRLNDLRMLHLYDTFEGMTEPGEFDVDYRGVRESDGWDTAEAKAVAITQAQVEDAMRSTGYPFDRIRFVKGPVEHTVPDQAPEQIAVLRLDTDWYESTRHELEHLYPRLVPGGVLIVDDYGYYEGARRAVDEYFADTPVFLARLDYTGRIAVKR